MKLKPCKACGNQVSPSAKSCPKCGQPIRTGNGLKNAGLLLLIAGVIVGGLGKYPEIAGASFVIGFGLVVMGRARD